MKLLHTLLLLSLAAPVLADRSTTYPVNSPVVGIIGSVIDDTDDIDVLPVNLAPSITGPYPTTGTVDIFFDFTPQSSDPDGDTLIFTSTPSVVTTFAGSFKFMSTSGRWYGVPTAGNIGTHGPFTICADDSVNAPVCLQPFMVTISAQPSNSPPTISGTPTATIQEDDIYNFTPTSGDVDGDPLSFYCAPDFPEWLTCDSETGEISGLASNDEVGTWSGIDVCVSDGINADVCLGTFSITVTNVNDIPVISGNPPLSILAGQTYNFTPTVTDPDAGDTFTFVIDNCPAWATCSTVTGNINGVTTAGTFAGIVITVTDAFGDSDQLGPFTITVTTPQADPVWQGSFPQGNTTPADFEFTEGVTECKNLQALGYVLDAQGDQIYIVHDATSTALPSGATAPSTTSLCYDGAGAATGVITGVRLIADDAPNNTAPTWPNMPGGFTAIDGTLKNIDLNVRSDDADGDALTYLSSGVALPTGWAVIGTNLNYNGIVAAGSQTTGHKISADDGTHPPVDSPAFTLQILAAGDAEADWTARSTAAGVLMATNFDTSGEVTTYADDGNNSWDTVNKFTGGGSYRIDILKTDSTLSGEWVRYLSDDERRFDQSGDEFYVQYRQYIPAYLIQHRWEGSNYSGGYSQGFKSNIISHFANSNTNFELVIQNSGQLGYPQGYNQDGQSTAIPWHIATQSGYSNSDFRHQSAIFVPNCDVPPDGSDRTQAERNASCTYGGLYKELDEGHRTAATGFPRGEYPPGWVTGAVLWPQDGWITITEHVKIGSMSGGNYSGSTHTWETWVASEDTGCQNVLLHSSNTIKLGNAGTFEAIWLLHYRSNGSSDGGRLDTFTLYDELIVSTNPIAAPAVCTP